MRRLVVGALLLATMACRPRYQDGEWRCDTGNACPDGFRCGGPADERRCFLEDHGFSLDVSVTGRGQGTLEVLNTTLVSGTTRSVGVTFGDRLTLTARPVAGSGFYGWTGPCASAGRNATCTFEVDADATIEARFEPLLRVEVAPTLAGILTPEFTGGVACEPDAVGCRMVMVGETAVVSVPPPATGSFGGWANAPCGGRTPCAFTPTNTLPLTLGAVANVGATPTYARLLTAGASSRTVVSAIVADADGNLYLAGTFDGALPLGPSTLSSAGKRDLFVAKLAADRSAILWAASFGSVEDEDAQAITLDLGDAGGLVWVAGTFRGNMSVNVGGTPQAVAYGGGANDGFLAGFDRQTGALTRLSQLGDTGSTRPRALADVVGAGGVHMLVIAGEYSGALRWIPVGGAAGPPIGGAPVDQNAFVIRALVDGALSDAVFRGAAGDDGVTTVDANGSDVYLGGYYATAFEGLPPPMARDAFVLRYDAVSGTIGSQFGLGGSGADETTAVGVRVVGGTPVVWAAGTFESTAAVEGSTAITADGVGELFLVRLDGGLGGVSASVHGGEVGDRVNDLAIDADGEVTLAGTFSNPIRFGGRSLNALGTDAFLAKVDGARTVLYLHGFGAAGTQRGRGVALRGEGAVMVGSFDGNFASGMTTSIATATGIEDGFLIEVGP